MPNFLLGRDGKFYLGTAVTAAFDGDDVTAATEVSNIKNLNINMTQEMTDISTRASGGWKHEAPTVKSGSITFDMQWKPDDSQFTAIKAAFLAGSEVFAVALDQAKTVTGAQGPGSNFVVANFTKTENLTEAQTVSVELRPSSYTAWFTKSA